MQILVFKTNLTDAWHIQEVSASLDVHPHIMQWNVDLHDCDKVLRVVSKDVEAREIEQLVNKAGYHCEELQ